MGKFEICCAPLNNTFVALAPVFKDKVEDRTDDRNLDLGTASERMLEKLFRKLLIARIASVVNGFHNILKKYSNDTVVAHRDLGTIFMSGKGKNALLHHTLRLWYLLLRFVGISTH